MRFRGNPNKGTVILFGVCFLFPNFGAAVLTPPSGCSMLFIEMLDVVYWPRENPSSLDSCGRMYIYISIMTMVHGDLSTSWQKSRQ